MPDKLPHLVEQEPFPPLPPALSQGRLQIDLRLQVAEDGTVSKGDILNASGDAAWDSLALTKIKKWRFSPAVYNGKPMAMWINIAARIKFEEPLFMRLSEIVCPSIAIADSVHALLTSGADFGLLATNFSISQSKDQRGDLGQIDICRYRDEVRKVLTDLKVDQVSDPVAVGDRYVIFKRQSEDIRFQ
jgi:TonB family protein